MDPYIVIDLETTATEPWNGHMLCLSAADSWGNVGVWHPTSIPKWVVERIADPSIAIVSHSKFDPRFLSMLGWEVGGPLHDTMVMAHILNENTRLSLEALAEQYCGVIMDKRLSKENNELWFKDDKGVKWKLDDPGLPLEDVMRYCRRDVEATQRLYITLYKMLEDGLWLQYWKDEEVPFTRILLDMELAGLPINLEKAGELREVLVKEFSSLETEILDDLGYVVNLASPNQLVKILFSKVWQQSDRIPITKEERDCLRARCEHDVTDGLSAQCYQPPKGFYLEKAGTAYASGYWMRKGLGLKATPPNPDSKTGQPSTSTPVLLTYHADQPFVQKLCLKYRKLDKVITTYLDVYPKRTHEGRLHGQYDQTGTATHRLSSRQPNMENQPARGELGRQVRELFEGNLIVGDHSQLEPRLMGHFSGDPVLLDIYKNNKDIYIVMGEYIFGKKLTKEDEERDQSKILVLSMGYGAYGARIAQTMCLNGYPTTPDEGDEYVKHVQRLFGTFFDWRKWLIADAKTKGYVKSIGGRMRRLAYAFGDAKFKVRNKGERQAVNAVIQGSAADIVRRNMLQCYVGFPYLNMLAQVHDEIIWEHKGEDQYEPGLITSRLAYFCENPGYNLKVPLKFEPSFCNTWADKGGKIELPEDDDESE